MSGFVKTYLCAERDYYGELSDLDTTRDMYYPLSNARCFQRVSREQHAETRCLFADNASLETEESVHFYFNVLVEDKGKKCKAKNNGCTFYRTGYDNDLNCPLLDLFFPIYANPMDHKTIQWVVIHPDERDRMERFLAGTLDPMHDLVHELRYNPAFQFGKDVQDAKNDFNKRTRGE